MNCGFERHYQGPGLIPCGSDPVRAWEPFCRRGKRSAALLLSLSFLVAWIFSVAQAIAGQASGEKEIATQDLQSTFKVQVQRNMVLVRVVIRDSNGRPVPNLRKEDFRLWDSGKRQEIDQFSVESSSRTAAVAPGEKSDEAGAPEAGAAKTTARNYQALYFDDLQMEFGDIARARDAADRYLAATLTAADRVGIFTSSGQDNLDFTDDRSKLHEALFKIRPRPVVLPGEPECPDIGQYQAYLIVHDSDLTAREIAMSEAAQCVREFGSMVEPVAKRVFLQGERVADLALRGLEQVIRRTALLPGQRSVIILSPGFLRYYLESQIEEVTDRALRSSVVINALDPRGLYAIIPGGDASQKDKVLPVPSTGDGLNLASPLNKQQMITAGFARAEDVLYDFVTGTGGQFFHNSNDLDKSFRLVGTLADVSYALAFSPHNLKFDGHFHPLRVSLVNPAGFTIQARHGYLAPKASEDAANKGKEEIEQAMYSQDELKELPIDVHTQFYRINEADARLTVLTHLDMSSVRFRKEQERNQNDVTFVTVLFDMDGKYVMAREKRVEFRLRDSTLARLTQTGITLRAEFDLKPGTYVVRQVVRDSEAGRLSGLNRTVEIPY